MKNQYLIRMEEPEDCVFVNNSQDYYYRRFLNPATKYLKNEIDCMHFHTPSSEPVFYHEHDSGSETFFVSQGKFLCNCMGRDFIMEAGDVFHIQPWMGHGFTAIEPNSRLNIMFMGIDQQAKSQASRRVKNNFVQTYEKLSRKGALRDFGHYFFANNRNLPVNNEVPPEQIQQLRPAGTGLRVHDYEKLGLKMYLKVAKYETQGVKEIWELQMKPGFYCKWDDFLPEYRLFYVTAGRIRCTVRTSDEETFEFDAVKENIVHIPPYTPFSFEVIEEARMYDLDCPSRIQDLCEEAELMIHNDPGKANDMAAILSLCKELDLNCTDFGYNSAATSKNT